MLETLLFEIFKLCERGLVGWHLLLRKKAYQVLDLTQVFITQSVALAHVGQFSLQVEDTPFQMRNLFPVLLMKFARFAST